MLIKFAESGLTACNFTVQASRCVKRSNGCVDVSFLAICLLSQVPLPSDAVTTVVTVERPSPVISCMLEASPTDGESARPQSSFLRVNSQLSLVWPVFYDLSELAKQPVKRGTDMKQLLLKPICSQAEVKCGPYWYSNAPCS